MENELIKITTDEKGNSIVLARDLHEFLGLRKKFTDWIKKYTKIDNEYGFEENVDFTSIHSEVNPTNGVPLIEYALTVDMAKELSMLSKTERGKEARKYFIKCEKKLKENVKLISAQQEIKELKNSLEDFKRATEEAKKMYKPSHKMKLDYSKMIRALTNNDEEYDIVKQWVFANLGYTKWEDACIDDKKKIVDTINTVARLLTIKKMEQLSMF